MSLVRGPLGIDLGLASSVLLGEAARLARPPPRGPVGADAGGLTSLGAGEEATPFGVVLPGVPEAAERNLPSALDFASWSRKAAISGPLGVLEEGEAATAPSAPSTAAMTTSVETLGSNGLTSDGIGVLALTSSTFTGVEGPGGVAAASCLLPGGGGENKSFGRIQEKSLDAVLEMAASSLSGANESNQSSPSRSN